MSGSFGCGHPIAPPFMGVRANGKAYCRECANASHRRWRQRQREAVARDPEVRRITHMQYRIRVLPEQLDKARHKLTALENEARRLGMTDLLEARP